MSIFLIVVLSCYLVFGVFFYNCYFKFSWPLRMAIFIMPPIVLLWPFVAALISLESEDDED